VSQTYVACYFAANNICSPDPTVVLDLADRDLPSTRSFVCEGGESVGRQSDSPKFPCVTSQQDAHVLTANQRACAALAAQFPAAARGSPHTASRYLDAGTIDDARNKVILDLGIDWEPSVYADRPLFSCPGSKTHGHVAILLPLNKEEVLQRELYLVAQNGRLADEDLEIIRRNERERAKKKPVLRRRQPTAENDASLAHALATMASEVRAKAEIATDERAPSRTTPNNARALQARASGVPDSCSMGFQQCPEGYSIGLVDSQSYSCFRGADECAYFLSSENGASCIAFASADPSLACPDSVCIPACQ